MAKIEGFTARVEFGGGWERGTGGRGGLCGKDRGLYSKGGVGRILQQGWSWEGFVSKIDGFTGKVELGGLCGKDRGLYRKGRVGRTLWQR